MKIKNLIELLQKCNPEAEVILYNRNTEDDSLSHRIEEYEILKENDIHYCQGDSCALDCIGKPVVYIIGY